MDMHLRDLGVGLITVVLLASTGCDDNLASPSENANLIVALTDDHTDEVEEVNIFFTSVTANPVEGPPETLTLVLDPNPQDLLVLQDAVVPLATGIVEPGDYERLTVNIDQQRSNVVVAQEALPLRVPSEEIKILGGFSVADDGSTTVTLDFDAEASLVRLGNGDWLLKPVIVMHASR